MKLEFIDDDGNLYILKSVKISQVDELVAAVRQFDHYLLKKTKEMYLNSGDNNKIDVWRQLDRNTIEAIKKILELHKFELSWEDLSLDDLERLLLDDYVENRQALIRQVNGFSFNSGINLSGDDDTHETILAKYLTSILMHLGGGVEHFDTAVKVCQELSPDDLNYVLESLNAIKTGKTTEQKQLKSDLDITDSALADLLVQMGFGEVT